MTLSVAVQNATRPARDKALSNAVNAQTPSSETTNSSSTARTVSACHALVAISASTATISSALTVGDAQEHHAVPPGIHLDEVVAVGGRQAQRDAAALILFAAGRLDAKADLRILDGNGFVDREGVVGVGRRAPLFERDAAGGRRVVNQRPGKLRGSREEFKIVR